MLTNIVVVVLVTRSVSYLGSHRCRVDIDMHSLGDNGRLTKLAVAV